MNVVESTLTGPQLEFMQISERYPGIVGGFGSGKTTALVAWLLAQKLSWPMLDCGYYAPTFDLIKLIAWPRLQEQLTTWGFRHTLNKNDQMLYIHGYGKVIFRSLDNAERIVGYEHADAVVDEFDTLGKKKAAEAWRRILARNRQMKRRREHEEANRIANGTTPEGFRYTYDRWDKRGGGQYQLIRASSYSNQHNLPDNFIEDMLEEYPPQLVEAYIHGHFVNLTQGSVYRHFDRELNNTNERIRPGEAVHIGLDFNVGNMHAVTFVIRDNRPYALDEIVGLEDTPDMIDEINDRYADSKAIFVYPDASGKARTTTNASISDIALLQKERFIVEVKDSQPPIRDRVKALSGLILNAKGERRLLVNTKQCPQLTESLEQQVWAPNGKPDKTNGLDHIEEAAGYFAHYRFPVQRPQAGLVARVRGT